MSKENLLQETRRVLMENGKTSEDVEWCGSPEWGWFTWMEFAELADKDYDNGYGGQIVAKDLLIVGKDWWLERHEYDGSEWWEFKTLPKKPECHKVPKCIFAKYGWSSLKEIDEE